MRKRFLHRIAFLLMAIVCVALLTGCPNISEEEWERLKNDGRALLKQALQDNYGLKESDYKIQAEDVIPKSAQGYNSAKYQLKVGEKFVTAEVHIDEKLVFTDYYGKEFEEALTAYLDRKMEDSQIFRTTSLKRMDIRFWPLVSGHTGMAMGTIPASVVPEGFEAYLEKCEEEKVLNVSLWVVWYSKESKVPENLLKRLLNEEGSILTGLQVAHFATDPDDAIQLKDLVENCYFSSSSDRHSIYEYLQVKENLVVRRTYDSYEEKDAANGAGIQATFDGDGHLHITPGKEYYSLFLRDVKEGTAIRYALEEGASPSEYSTAETDMYFEDWYVYTAPGWNIVIEEK